MVLYQPLLVIPSLVAGTSTQGLSSIGPKLSEGQASLILLPSSETSIPDSSRGEITPPRIDIGVGTTNVGPYLKALVPSSLSHETNLESSGFMEQLLVTRRPLMNQIKAKVSLTLRQEPIEIVAPKPVLSLQCNSPISGTQRAKLEKEAPQTVVGDATTSSSIPRAHRSKRKNPPSLGGPARAHVKK
eukprot:Gb_19960 [translate_table: standard]